MKQKISELTLYRWRYGIGYLVAGTAVICALLFAALFVPNGLRDAERAASVHTGSLQFQHFDPQTVVDLPYHFLQRVSFAFLDVTTLSIKLPSLIFALLAIIGMYVLLATWFKRNVAIITTAVGATLPLFLFASQDATPTIYHFAISLWLLATATFVAHERKPLLLWKIIFFVLLALNLYTPLGVYLDLAVLSTVLFHPHIRFLTRRVDPNKLLAGAVVALAVLVPMIYSLVTTPKLIVTLLGVPSTVPDFVANMTRVAHDYFGFASTSGGINVRPMFTVGLALLLVLGIYHFLHVRYTARNYVISFWAIVLIPIIIISPEYSVYIFPVAVILAAFGIQALISEWYRLFPRNPYARVVGLFPIGIIVAGLVITGMQMYAVSYHYLSQVANNFDNDLVLLDSGLDFSNATAEKPATLVTSSGRLEFYNLVSKYDKRFVATTTVNTDRPLLFSNTSTVTKPTTEPSRILTDTRLDKSDRFYIYTDAAK